MDTKQATNACHQKYAAQWRQRPSDAAQCDAVRSGEGLCQGNIFGHGHFLGAALGVEFTSELACL